jgi:hypothetical protein
MRDGTVLPDIPTYNPEFTHYAESWRVDPQESLLCDSGKVAPGMPPEPTYANNLPEPERERVRTICTAAGIHEQPFLDDCMLDVSALGDDSVTKAFAHVPVPTKDMRPAFP